MRKIGWAVLGVAVLAMAVGAIEPRYVLAPALGLLIFRIGLASFASLSHGAQADTPAVAVDPAVERVSYACSTCGAEYLLLIRGAASPPRHCGERTIERSQIASGVRP